MTSKACYHILAQYVKAIASYVTWVEKDPIIIESVLACIEFIFILIKLQVFLSK